MTSVSEARESGSDSGDSRGSSKGSRSESESEEEEEGEEREERGVVLGTGSSGLSNPLELTSDTKPLWENASVVPEVNNSELDISLELTPDAETEVEIVVIVSSEEDSLLSSTPGSYEESEEGGSVMDESGGGVEGTPTKDQEETNEPK